MRYIEENNKIIMTEFDSFQIDEILECGQCFRFEKLGNKKFKIVAHSKVLFIEQSETSVQFSPCNKSDFENIWINYFDLNRDYNAIKNLLTQNDEVLKDAVKFASGIRILNQQPFEMLISFIISQNNRIPQIKQVIKNLCAKYGTRIENTDEFSFPTPDELQFADVTGIMECRAGFRAKYILDAVQRVISGEISLDKTTQMPALEVKQMLMKIKGVGTKVADCILLFGFSKYDHFPTDVWIKRIMEYYYFNQTETKIEDIHKLASEKYGENAGFAQQYLFHFARVSGLFK